jgi:hypothetical protein
MTTKVTKEMMMDHVEGLERSYETLSKLVADVAGNNTTWSSRRINVTSFERDRSQHGASVALGG